MPILVRDPWRKQYFNHVRCPDHVVVPIDDMDAWLLYPGERHIYDRLHVALAQGLPAGPHGTTPDQFPVFSKPIVNLKGMGIGSRVILSPADYEHSYEAGHFWMPVLTGAHVSTDCALVDGKIIWARHATGEVFRDGMFRYWTIHAKRDAILVEKLQNFALDQLPDYTGMVNFETINGYIIEAHLRFADQWCDLYGSTWVEAVVSLYSSRQWNFSEPEREGYSIPLFADERFDYVVPAQEILDTIRSRTGISSLQITFDPEKANADHAKPPGGLRLVLINAWDYLAGMSALDEIAECFPADRLIRP